jgi:hypothetical protein
MSGFAVSGFTVSGLWQWQGGNKSGKYHEKYEMGLGIFSKF